MAQTVNKQYQDKYVGGQITDSYGLATQTAVSEETGTIKFEDLLIKGTAKRGALLPAAAFTYQDIYGIVVRDPSKAQVFRTGAIEYNEDDHIGVVRKAKMAITLSGSVAKDANLFFVHTAGGASAIHTWRGDLDTDKASKTPIIALEAGSSGDVIEVLVDIDMQIGVS